MASSLGAYQLEGRAALTAASVNAIQNVEIELWNDGSVRVKSDFTHEFWIHDRDAVNLIQYLVTGVVEPQG